jgi:hypothetical protein
VFLKQIRHAWTGGAPAASARLALHLSQCITGAGRHCAAAAEENQAGAEGAAAARVLLVACCHSAEDLPASLRRCFTHDIALDAPDQDARLQLLKASSAGPDAHIEEALRMKPEDNRH